MVAVWYVFIPFSGAIYSRIKWKGFRDQFDELRLYPLLDYKKYRSMGEGIFRFTGGIESITDEHTLWVKGENLSIPVSLENTTGWLVPAQVDDTLPDAPEKIRWDRLSTLNENAKVFVGGVLQMQNGRLSFVSTKERPLMVIFYNCDETMLVDNIIRCGRTSNEYWNSITPASLFFGALSQAYIAASFINRPAYRLLVIYALIAIFIPLIPLIPPGLILTVIYRRLAWYARTMRTYRDLAKLPERYLAKSEESAALCSGEKYGYRKFDFLPDDNIPFVTPGKKGENPHWHIYGVLDDASQFPVKSKDPFVSFGVLPDLAFRVSRKYSIKGYLLEITAWLLILIGITINIIFILIILRLLRLISF
jgi:hypothetical protein